MLACAICQSAGSPVRSHAINSPLGRSYCKIGPILDRSVLPHIADADLIIAPVAPAEAVLICSRSAQKRSANTLEERVVAIADGLCASVPSTGWMLRRQLARGRRIERGGRRSRPGRRARSCVSMRQAHAAGVVARASRWPASRSCSSVRNSVIGWCCQKSLTAMRQRPVVENAVVARAERDLERAAPCAA